MVKGIALIAACPALAVAGAEELARSSFADYYQAPAVSVAPSVPQYPLPLDPAGISNWEPLSRSFDLSRIQPLIVKNGFAVLGARAGEDIIEPYKMLKESAVPIFVTADTLLHLYHVQFDETLKEVEEREFFGLLAELTRALLADSLEQEARYEGNLREAAGRNTAYFAVALKLLDPEAAVPAATEAPVGQELSLIDAHTGFAPSPIFVYREDYSQYVPRGHYTRSDLLQRYFKAMMWYGRLGFLLRNSDLLPAPNAAIQTLGACLIADALRRVQVRGEPAFRIWDRLYTVTAFYVGLADDLTPNEYLQAIGAVAGATADMTVLADSGRFDALRAHLASLRNPKIYGGTGECAFDGPYEPWQIDECLDKSKGLRFMGQRFIPDSYMFQNLVAMDYTGRGEPFTMVYSPVGPIRGFPRGLDAMDILGSARARQILIAEGDTEYALYEEQRQKLLEEFSALEVRDWNRNLYWGWLHALKALIGEWGPGYPTFMQTEAWRDKSLNSALASWTELRHDTILYAKQSYTPIRTSLPPAVRGYVEPAPEFYARLLALTEMTTRGLDELKALNEPARGRLEKLAEVLKRLLDLSLKELRNEPLTDEEYAYIREIGATLEQTVLGVRDAGVKTTLIADVHTDENSRKVLEEGVGYVDLAVVVVPQPEGGLALALGPVLSYYEFKWPMADRLTDEAWREKLATQPPPRPPWTTSFVR